MKRNKFDEKKEVVKRFKEVEQEKNSYNAEIQRLNRQADKYKKHMSYKSLVRKDDIERKIQ
jgi:uncharacterized coiled-coil DUF342 family protein